VTVEFASAGEQAAPAEAVPAVSCRDVSYEFGDVRAVDHVSFDVAAGEVFGLLGPNGAGKTTTIRMITTLLKPPSGRIEVFGLESRRQAFGIRRLIGYVPQQLSIDGQLTGEENVTLFARLFDVPRRGRRDRVREALAVVGLSEEAGRMASTYSGGMVRRLELAQALVNRPRMLVLDEPTIGLDPMARDSVWERVLELRRDLGVTVLLTTHSMEEADEFCDRVGVMHQGSLRTLGRPEELKRSLGPDATLEDVFRRHAGAGLEEDGGRLRDVRTARRDARRLG
jgi:ABC-2 type transport system ATP-binding protein